MMGSRNLKMLTWIGGFMPVQQGASKVKTFSMVVQDDTQPMYMYCAAADQYVCPALSPTRLRHILLKYFNLSCQQGMVMTINA
jgi:hypothetical protein